MPLYLDTIRYIKKFNNDFEFGIGLSSNFCKSDIISRFSIDSGVVWETEDPLKLIESCDLIIATSGTVSLEATFMKIPCVVVYKLPFLSWAISKYLLNTNYISMTNILLNRPVLHELVQRQANVSNLSDCVYNVLGNLEKAKKSLCEIKNLYNSSNDCINTSSSLIVNYENICE